MALNQATSTSTSTGTFQACLQAQRGRIAQDLARIKRANKKFSFSI